MEYWQTRRTEDYIEPMGGYRSLEIENTEVVWSTSRHAGQKIT